MVFRDLFNSRAALFAAILPSFLLLSACTHSRPSETASENREAKTIDIGYGLQAERDVVTSVGSVDTEAARKSARREAGQMLQGRVSGVSVFETSRGISVRIRGITSPSGSNEPLYVVDGIPHRPTRGFALTGLSPSDIASIEVLKGSAASIYGIRGANGVIVIKTRRGNE